MEIKQDKKIMRAKIEPSQEDGYDFIAIAVPTENKQLKRSYENDEYFYQVLRTAEANINTDRLSSGLPLFDNHPYENSSANTLGITVGYEFTERGIEVKCKLGARADDALRNDIKNGIVKTVSIEGTVENYLIERTIGQIPIYYAELWEPESLSFAPVPNDISAQIEVKRAIAKQLKPELNKSKLQILINKF